MYILSYDPSYWSLRRWQFDEHSGARTSTTACGRCDQMHDVPRPRRSRFISSFPFSQGTISRIVCDLRLADSVSHQNDNRHLSDPTHHTSVVVVRKLVAVRSLRDLLLRRRAPRSLR